jgi:hypothetical protein
MAATKPILIVAQTIKEFDAWLRTEHNASRTSSRLPVNAMVGTIEYFYAELNRRNDWINTKQFSKVIYLNCEDKALDWFKEQISQRVKSPTSEIEQKAKKTS